MNHQRFSLVLLLLVTATVSFAQTNNNPNHRQWSATQRLKKEDFLIKVEDMDHHPSVAQFAIDCKATGLDFMTRNFNDKVANYMIKSASWIDTTFNINASLRYQQALFDLSEIYTRHFRKALKENRKKLVKGVDVIEEINDEIMTLFANRRSQMEKETVSGSKEEQLTKWELTIQTELGALKDYARK